MQKLTNILVSGTTGTTFMTACSALMSLIPEQEFREPEQLSKLVGRVAPWLSKPARVVGGWGAHYAMGFLFATVYVELWDRKMIEHSVKNGIVLGILSGLLGMLIWKATFSLHPLPPNNRKFDFYLQRIPAHMVFAVFATFGYRLLNTEIKVNTTGKVEKQHLG